ncbi:hypothetical protein Moror_15018 [Moniliophthora roreri MCA 2997]|uniref:Uncharacterized protein n=1 Tax=Moniliophthora roreri (strain MCA 2997) TaxID=1381753 RepID=V2XUT2_MONRO|nr:hypothetical protein Moror_15018 [Moniliophthora roreri MCA 2997]
MIKFDVSNGTAYKRNKVEITNTRLDINMTETVIRYSDHWSHLQLHAQPSLRWLIFIFPVVYADIFKGNSTSERLSPLTSHLLEKLDSTLPRHTTFSESPLFQEFDIA